MSIEFLLVHMTSTERTWASMVLGSARAPDDEVTGIARVLAAYEEAITETDAVIASVDDLDRVVRIPEGTRWAAPGTEWSVRWVLLHLIHETARHAGHADIIRESIDGAKALPLMAAVEAVATAPDHHPVEAAGGVRRRARIPSWDSSSVPPPP